MTEVKREMYWSRIPGNFVNKLTGVPFEGVNFKGSVREWYECLVETIIDMRNLLETGECFTKEESKIKYSISVSPDVATILMCTVLFRPELSCKDPFNEKNKETMYIGELHGIKVYNNPEQQRNVIGVFNAEKEVHGYINILDMDII